MDLTQNNFAKTSNSNKLLHAEDDESQYLPYIKQVLRKKIKREIKNTGTPRSPKHNSSTWTLQENLTYKQFLKSNVHLFELEKKERRVIKINVLVSKYVKTRTPQQCRSHHQKMLIYHKNIGSIVSYIQSLQTKEPQNKPSKQVAQDYSLNMSTPTTEMREIEWGVNMGSPSLWDCMVQDAWMNI